MRRTRRSRLSQRLRSQPLAVAPRRFQIWCRSSKRLPTSAICGRRPHHRILACRLRPPSGRCIRFGLAGRTRPRKPSSKISRRRRRNRPRSRPLCKCGTPQHGLSSNTMALITSDCGAMRLPAHQMALIASGCVRQEESSALLVAVKDADLTIEQLTEILAAGNHFAHDLPALACWWNALARR